MTQLLEPSLALAAGIRSDNWDWNLGAWTELEAGILSCILNAILGIPVYKKLDKLISVCHMDQDVLNQDSFEKL